MIAAQREAITTIEELLALEEGEMVEGYRDGFSGEPEPGGNRSRAYWHGWRNGNTDFRRAHPDDAQRSLASECAAYIRGKDRPL